MGVHEWLLRKGYRYEMNDELGVWLGLGYVEEGEAGANDQSDHMKINRPNRYRAIAPTGTIGIMASTTTGIEPLYAVAYKRRYLTNGDQWNYEYVVDATAEMLIQQYDLDPDDIETASSLANDPERRIKFQYEVQKFVDMGISSTINLPPFDEQTFTPEDFSRLVLKYAKGLRGLTVYPDGARGGQPFTRVPYHIGKNYKGMVYKEQEIACDT
jgi:ribonucleoside-diphosphate reductase alpha chain